MLYSFAKAILRFLFFLFGLKIEGLDNIPREGPIIIAANHVSNWDPVVVGITVPRTINFMAKSEFFDYFFLGGLFKQLNAFPVKRGTPDRKAIKNALELLAQGKALGIFPEGRRIIGGMESKAQAGIAMLALKSGAPVIPVACIGTNRALPVGWLQPLIVRIGKPLYLEEYQGQKISSLILEKSSSEIMQEINILLSK